MDNSIKKIFWIGVVVIVLIVGVSMYNQPVVLKNDTAEQYGNVASALQRQATVILNAQAGFSTVAQLDKSIVDGMVTEALAMSRQLKNYCDPVSGNCAVPQDQKSLEALNKQVASFDSSYGTFMLYVSKNPQLRSADIFGQFMTSVEGSANRVNTERRVLNEKVNAYKTHCDTFPGSIFCGMHGFTGREFSFFKASENALGVEDKAPELSPFKK